MISSRITNELNVRDFSKAQKFQMTRAILQRKLTPIYKLVKVISLEEQSAYRARNAVLIHVLGYHKNYVRFLNDLCSRAKEVRHACEIIREQFQGENLVENAYSGFMVALLFSIKAERFWESHIYIDMFDLYNLARGFKAGITTHDADN